MGSGEGESEGGGDEGEIGEDWGVTDNSSVTSVSEASVAKSVAAIAGDKIKLNALAIVLSKTRLYLLDFRIVFSSLRFIYFLTS
jgi:hypothetical protein